MELKPLKTKSTASVDWRKRGNRNGKRESQCLFMAAKEWNRGLFSGV